MHLAEQYADDLTNNTRRVLSWQRNSMPLRRLEIFENFLRANNYTRHANYVEKIIALYSDILVLKPSQFRSFHNDFFSGFTDVDLKCQIVYKKNKPFYEHVVDCMRYDDIRSGLMRQYMKAMKIKACVYCNAQYAITTEEFEDEQGHKKRIGTYQFDHFLPKSLYPYLSTSFFNLQPSCSTCNISKSASDSLFNLYTENPDDVDIFTFKLTPEHAIGFYLQHEISNIKIHLDSRDSNLLHNHQKLFHIDLLYAEHTDIAEYIIVKCRTYNETYMQSLQESLNVLFPNGTEDPGFFFWGYYMEKEHIHYQPLTKLVQDIVEIMRI